MALCANRPREARPILWMTNGEKTFRYTYARRGRECRFRQVRLATEDKKRHWFCNSLVLPGLDPATGESIPCCPSIEDVETKFLCSVTSKSCKLDRFDAYLAARERVQVHLKAFYCQTFFRSSKYSVYLAKKSSEVRALRARVAPWRHHKLVDRIRNTFAEEGKALVIFWGNWGRLPNRLRNGCAALRHLAAKPQDLDAGHRPPALHPPPPVRRHPQQSHLLRHHPDRVRGGWASPNRGEAATTPPAFATPVEEQSRTWSAPTGRRSTESCSARLHSATRRGNGTTSGAATS